MKTSRLFIISLISLFIISCTSLKPVTSVRIGTIEDYQFIYISPTNSLTSSTGTMIGGQYIATTKSVNPADVIAGILSKKGLVRLPELKPDITDQTLIVNYGESGRRDIGLGYTIEVTIQFISAKSNQLICSCTAEGLGSTEADDIRQAITRCLDELMSEE
jgi:hypothetical protein